MFHDALILSIFSDVVFPLKLPFSAGISQNSSRRAQFHLSWGKRNFPTSWNGCLGLQWNVPVPGSPSPMAATSHDCRWPQLYKWDYMEQSPSKNHDIPMNVLFKMVSSHSKPSSKTCRDPHIPSINDEVPHISPITREHPQFKLPGWAQLSSTSAHLGSGCWGFGSWSWWLQF
jgi:hypothetical protein